jgi:SnoaL-like domain
LGEDLPDEFSAAAYADLVEDGLEVIPHRVRRDVQLSGDFGRGQSAQAALRAPDAVIHMPTGEVLNPDELKIFVGTWRETFPDWHSTFEELIAEGDRVAER